MPLFEGNIVTRPICPACREALSEEAGKDVREYQKHVHDCFDVHLLQLKKQIKDLTNEKVHYKCRCERLTEALANKVLEFTKPQTPSVELVMTCPLCKEYSTTDWGYVRDHVRYCYERKMRQEKSKVLMRCPICNNYEHANWVNLHSHIYQCHVRKAEVNYTCPLCNNSNLHFQGVEAFYTHLSLCCQKKKIEGVTTENKYICPLCHNTVPFLGLEAFYTHVTFCHRKGVDAKNECVKNENRKLKEAFVKITDLLKEGAAE